MYISGLNYIAGDKKDISKIEGITNDKENLLRAAGIQNFCVSTQDPFQNAFEVAKNTLKYTGVSSEEIDLLIYAIEPSINSSNNWVNTYNNFKDIKWLISNLGIVNAFPIGLSFFNCTSFLSAIDIANVYIDKKSYRNVLIVLSGNSTDSAMLPRLPDDNSVEGDGAASFIVSNNKTSGSFEIISYLINNINLNKFISEGQFLFNKYAVEKSQTIKKNCDNLFVELDIKKIDIKKFVLQNINYPVMNLYRTICGFTKDQLYSENLPEYGHLIGIDNLVNLADLKLKNQITDGDYLYILGTSGIQVGSVILKYKV